MTEQQKEAYGPTGDAACHPLLPQLEAALRALPLAPNESGRLMLIVCRRADGIRETPSHVHLSPEEGARGDGWSRRPPRDLEAQLAVMRSDVAQLVANGQPLTVFGDNLFVDFDICAGNLPVGTRLRLGTALLQVTPKPHNGCAKFQRRFGKDALHFVSAPSTRNQNLRGIYWKIIERGDARVGDAINIVARA